MSIPGPATLGELFATCEICGERIATPPMGSEIRTLDGQVCLVIPMDAADLEMHMLGHGQEIVG